MTKVKSLQHAPLHPFLIALAPVISLYVVNKLALSAFDMVRPVVVCLFIALVAVVASRAVSNSMRSAAILGSYLLLGVFAYGYVFRSMSLAFEIEIDDRYFLPMWLLLIGGIYAVLVRILRRTENSLRNITTIFNISSVALVASASMPLVLGSMASQPALPTPNAKNQVNEPTINESVPPIENLAQTNKVLPDVYYLILDGYARGDVLKSRFDFDNSNFLDWLEARGFFIGRLSHSNYPWTHLSLSATLNFEYLQTLLPEGLGSHGPDEFRERYQFLARALNKHFIENSRVHRYFSSLGYRIIANKHTSKREDSTSLFDVLPNLMDDLEDAMSGSLTDFEEALISNTIAQPSVSMFRNVVDAKTVRISKHDRIVHELEAFADAAKEDGPKFVFYHVTSPHQPYSFDENGGMVTRHPVYEVSAWFEDRIAVPGYTAWNRENYPKNVAGLNIHVKRAIKRILDESGGNAIVIVQADHGSSYGLDPHSALKTDVVERFGILNAIFLPSEFPRHDLEEGMSSVNTFRVILRNVFDENLVALENRAFYSTGDLNFEDVTRRLIDPR